MKQLILIISTCFSANAFAYDFSCDIELDTSAGTESFTLFSENENIQTVLKAHDVSIQFASRQELPYQNDYYRFSIFGPDTSPYIFSGRAIQDCGFGTRTIQIMCTPNK